MLLWAPWAAFAQTFDLAVPVQLSPEGPPLVVVPVHIGEDQSLHFDVRSFLETMDDTLTALAIARVEELEPDAAGRVSLADIQTAGIPMAFDSSRVALIIDPTSPSLLPTPLVVSGRRGSGIEDFAEDPADFSAFVNVRPAYEYVYRTDPGEDTWTFRSGFDGAIWVRTGDWIGDFALVASGTYVDRDQPQRWQREFTRLVFDMREDANRLTFGDLNFRATGLQAVPQMGGVSFAREFGLQPERLRAVGGGRVFDLQAESDVDIYVNDQLVFTQRLPAGRYQLDDLGLATGANDVRIEATDLVGRRETIVIDAFYDSRLLPVGEWDFGIALGVPSEINEGILQYDGDRRFITAFAEYGIDPELTVGLNMETLFGRDVRWRIGASADAATAFGNFALDAAATGGDDIHRDAAVSLDYRPNLDFVFGDGVPVFDLSVDYVGDNYLTDIVATDPNTGAILATSARLSFNITPDLSASISGGYEWLNEPGFDRRFAGLSASQQLGFGTLSGSLRWSATEEPDSDDTQLLLTFSMPFGRGHSTRTQYNLGDQSYRFRYDYRGDADVGGFDASIGAVQDDGDMFPEAEFTYRSNYGVAQVSNDALAIGSGSNRNVLRFTLASSVAYAGGHVGIGRPIGDAFTLIARHPSLEGREVIVEPSELSGPEAVADFLPGVVSLAPNTTSTVAVEVPDLPPGYDLGNTEFVFVPPTYSGTLVEIGKANFASALGVAVDAAGAPIELTGGQAVAIDEERAPAVTTFTNAEGRFVLQGLEPGVAYRVQFGDLAAEIVVPQAAIGELVELGTVQFR